VEVESIDVSGVGSLSGLDFRRDGGESKDRSSSAVSRGDARRDRSGGNGGEERLVDSEGIDVLGKQASVAEQREGAVPEDRAKESDVLFSGDRCREAYTSVNPRECGG
jgi:hypothetical protein